MTTPATSPPPHVELSAVMRLEADYLPPGPRAKLLRLADELDSNGDPVVVSCGALQDAIAAATAQDHSDGSSHRSGGPSSVDPGDEVPFHISMPPHLRRSAYRRPDGPDRDALLRYADELEEKGDASLVSSAVFRAALRAHAAEDD